MKKLLIISIAAIMLGGCAKKNETGQEMKKSYLVSLNDSIRKVKSEMDSCNDVANTLSDKVNDLLPEFRAVNKSREVEGYTIFQGWENRYPLQSTGVVARLNGNRELELVAALQGGVFDQIRVTGPSVTATSNVVPNDQALNYRRDGLTTVMFMGPQADSVADLIANNELNPITVTYLNGGKPTGSWKVANGNAKMITMTYLLYSANKEQLELRTRTLKLGERLKLLRRHRENRVKTPDMPR